MEDETETKKGQILSYALRVAVSQWGDGDLSYICSVNGLPRFKNIEEEGDGIKAEGGRYEEAEGSVMCSLPL